MSHRERKTDRQEKLTDRQGNKEPKRNRANQSVRQTDRNQNEKKKISDRWAEREGDGQTDKRTETQTGI